MMPKEPVRDSTGALDKARQRVLDEPAAAGALRGMAIAVGEADRLAYRTWWRRLVVVAPDDLDALSRLIAAHLADGHRREARALTARLVRHLPNHPKVHQIAERGFGPHDRGAARRALMRALVLQPDLTDASLQQIGRASCRERVS
jgi:hypothetical protein